MSTPGAVISTWPRPEDLQGFAGRLFFEDYSVSYKVVFLIDGFNVYFSVRDCMKRDRIQHGKWFDYRRYCEMIVKQNSNFPSGSVVARVRLYSAFAHHLHPDVSKRHKVLNEAMRLTNVDVVMGNFKKKTLKCNDCRAEYLTHEEKETDINVAMGVIEAFLVDQADCAVIVSGDTDLIAAIKAAKRFFPDKKIGIVTPAHRGNREIEKAAHFHIGIKPAHYEKYQLPNQIFDNEANAFVTKPPEW
jgi:uncharacterized LabA/DUF88 family protein